MGVLQRSKNTVYGLNADLAKIEADKIALTAVVNTNKTDATAALEAVRVVLRSDIDTNSADITALETIVAVVNGASSVDGSFRKAIADLIGTAPETLDTLQEIATSLKGDATVVDTITALISTKYSELEAAVNATKMAKSANLSDLADSATARTNLNVFSKEETQALAVAGGTVFVTEILTVTADKVTLTNAPKNGVVFNFATVRHTDENFVSYDIPVTVTATAGGKEFLLHPNASGDFDTKSVAVQYGY